METKIVEGMTSQDFENLLDEFAPQLQQAGEKTLRQMQEYWKIGRGATEARVKRMIEEGRLEKITGMTATGKRGSFYRMIQ
jgi:hypothetical protein